MNCHVPMSGTWQFVDTDSLIEGVWLGARDFISGGRDYIPDILDALAIGITGLGILEKIIERMSVVSYLDAAIRAGGGAQHGSIHA